MAEKGALSFELSFQATPSLEDAAAVSARGADGARSLNLGFFLTVQCETWSEFKLVIPLDPLPRQSRQPPNSNLTKSSLPSPDPTFALDFTPHSSTTLIINSPHPRMTDHSSSLIASSSETFFSFSNFHLHPLSFAILTCWKRLTKLYCGGSSIFRDQA